MGSVSHDARRLKAQGEDLNCQAFEKWCLQGKPVFLRQLSLPCPLLRAKQD